LDSNRKFSEEPDSFCPLKNELNRLFENLQEDLFISGNLNRKERQIIEGLSFIAGFFSKNQSIYKKIDSGNCIPSFQIVFLGFAIRPIAQKLFPSLFGDSYDAKKYMNQVIINFLKILN
jgi:hypothetical protein